MQEKSQIKRNILLYLDKKGISSYDFYKKSGVTRGVLSQNNGISEDNLMRFLAFAPDVNIVWLLTSKGEMLLSSHLSTYMIEEPPLRIVQQEPIPYQTSFQKKEEPLLVDEDSTPVSLALIAQMSAIIERTNTLQDKITTQAEEIGRLKAENEILREENSRYAICEKGGSAIESIAEIA